MIYIYALVVGATHLTPPPHLVRGTWRTQQFKDYNFNALGVQPNGGHLHPLLKVERGRILIFVRMSLK